MTSMPSKAFDVAALDYLVKPFDDERFDQAFERAKNLIRLRKVGGMVDQLYSILQGSGLVSDAPADPSSASPAPYLERIAVEMRGQIRVLSVADIDYIVASGPYAELYVRQDRYLIRERMHTLEERLNPAAFIRIHRSTIVQIDRIESFLRSGGGDYAVRLKDGRKLQVSRSRRQELEQRLGLDV